MEGKYIINGVGEITYDFYGKADEMVVSKNAKILKKLSNINQLGSIKIMYNGANYTRLEYLLLQVSLVNLVKESINNGNGLGSVNKKVTEQLGSDKLTGGEILQLLFIFSNVGHLKDTFSANKVIMHLLKENKYNLKSSFKKGLKGSDAGFTSIFWTHFSRVFFRNESTLENVSSFPPNIKWKNVFDIKRKR